MKKKENRYETNLVFGRGSGLGSHGGPDEDPVLPIARLVDQRHARGSTAAEQNRVDGHALGIFPSRVDDRALLRRGAEARVRVGCRAGRATLPWFAVPVRDLLRNKFE